MCWEKRISHLSKYWGKISAQQMLSWFGCNNRSWRYVITNMTKPNISPTLPRRTLNFCYNFSVAEICESFADTEAETEVRYISSHWYLLHNITLHNTITIYDWFSSLCCWDGRKTEHFQSALRIVNAGSSSWIYFLQALMQ